MRSLDEVVAQSARPHIVVPIQCRDRYGYRGLVVQGTKFGKNILVLRENATLESKSFSLPCIFRIWRCVEEIAVDEHFHGRPLDCPQKVEERTFPLPTATWRTIPRVDVEIGNDDQFTHPDETGRAGFIRVGSNKSLLVYFEQPFEYRLHDGFPEKVH